MFISLNTNLSMIKSGNALEGFNKGYFDSVKDLSSGIRINSASDDAANLSLSKKLDKTSSGLGKASENIQLGLNKIQTFDSYTAGISDSLLKIRDLAVQAQNLIYSNDELKSLNQEAQHLNQEIQIATEQANRELNIPCQGDLLKNINKLSEAEAISAGYNESHRIYTAQEFVDKISNHSVGDFILMNDIDMSELGTLNTSVISGVFFGSLDGNGNSIKNLSIKSDAGNYIGLFNTLSGAKIENIAVEKASLDTKNASKVGIIAAYSSGSEITNVYTSGSVEGEDMVGGIVGYNRLSRLLNSYSVSDISGDQDVGGLVGYNSGASSVISDSYFKGSAYVRKNIGGITGNNYGSAIIKKSYSKGSVYASSNAGGVAGYNNSGKINNSYSMGSVSGNSNIGGLVGLNNNGDIKNSYSEARVDGSFKAGGFLGESFSGTIDDSNFWNTEKSGQISSEGDAIGLTTSQIASKSSSPIKDWDNSVWDISGSRPYLLSNNENNNLTIQIGEKNNYSSRYIIEEIGLSNDLSINLSSAKEARASIQNIDEALNNLNMHRAKVGANITSLKDVLNQTHTRNNQLKYSNSRIKDTDMAYEAAKMTKNQLLSQAATSIFQQAQNISQSSVLSLYRF